MLKRFLHWCPYWIPNPHKKWKMLQRTIQWLFIYSKKKYLFIFQYGLMLKLCPMAVAILVFQSTNQTQTLYSVMEGTFQQWVEEIWIFSQSNSIISHSRHVEFPNGTNITYNVEDHLSSSSAKYGYIWSCGWWENVINGRQMMTDQKHTRIIQIDLWSKWTINMICI